MGVSERKRSDRIFPSRSRTSATTEVAERRRGARKPFIAEAVVVEAGSGSKLSGRSCDLVVHGFYMDTLNPLPQGTQVLVRLQHGDSRVEASGRVVYRIPGLGMGIAFNKLGAEQHAVLNRWLDEAGEPGEAFEVSLPPISAQQLDEPIGTDPMAARLISLLRKKGILTEQEANQLLADPAEHEF